MSVEELLAAIQGRADAATKGPWRKQFRDRVESAVEVRDEIGGETWVWYPFVAKTDSGMEDEPDPEQDEANSDFIAAARTDVPRLVAALQAVLALGAWTDARVPTGAIQAAIAAALEPAPEEVAS